jgi:hypothetical protein
MFFDLPLDEGEYSPDKTAQDGEMHGQSDDEAEEDDMDLLDWTEGDLSMDFDCDLELDLDIDMSPEESQTLSQVDSTGAACDVSVGSEEVPDDLLLGEDWNV